MEDKFGSLLKRLEAVTTKLESMPAGGTAAAPSAPVDVSEPDTVSVCERSERTPLPWRVDTLTDRPFTA